MRNGWWAGPALAALLAGCASGETGGAHSEAAAPVAFNGFVQQLVANTNDTAAPVETAPMTFIFNNEDEHAFDHL